MALPVLLDSEMNVEGAVALCLALGAEALDVRAVIAGGGGIAAEQSAGNAQRLLSALQPRQMPSLGCGCEPAGIVERSIDFGGNGLCDIEIPASAEPEIDAYEKVYREFLSGEGERCIVTTGALTTLASILPEMSATARAKTKVCVCGGSVWTKGNAGEHVESNFGRDATAASAICTSGMAVTIAPLDVTNYIALDASNIAHLAASGYRTGEMAARLLEPLVEQDFEPSYGKTNSAGLVAVACAIWPDLFLKTRMRLEIVVKGPEAGRCKPGLGGDKSKHVDLLTAVNAVDLLENILESLCHEEFVV
ncbi:MAG: nucleoside hydrolase [Phycisphaerales bacterium]|nr:nucleoside hydrolase [Phycisphaerales bacterium]MCB9856933.1 nucleoside hydrolase [Phycisphaerales bacterium]MCB9861940.1 nucleoside hydrolase [Phycisphaerales bacterium]